MTYPACCINGVCDCFHDKHRAPIKPPKPIVCLPLMRIPAKVEKGTKYLPEMWKPFDG